MSVESSCAGTCFVGSSFGGSPCGDASSCSTAWHCLPAILIQHIYHWLPLSARLQASTTCAHWREILWSPELWRKQTYFLDSKKALRRLQFFTENHGLLFAKSVELILPAVPNCSRAQYTHLKVQILSQLLQSIELLTQVHHLEKFVIKIQRKRANGNSLSLIGAQPEDLEKCNKSLEQIIRNNKYLAYLSFGCSPSDFWPAAVLENLSESTKRRIRDLHIATDHNNNQVNVLHNVVTGVGVNSLQHLQRLSIDWHNVTPAFLDAFNSRTSYHPLTKLNLFVLHHQCSDSLICHPEPQTWRAFEKKNKNVKISLIFVHEVEGVCAQLQHVYPVYMLKFVECSSICEIGYGKLILWHKETVRAHVMTSTASSLCELDNGHILWMYMRGCTLKYITVIGYFIYDDIVKLVGAAFSPHLEVFHVPKNQILTSAEASYFMVPISGSKVNELSRAMEGLLQRPWRPLRRHPLETNYFSDGYDDDFHLNAAPQDMLFQ